MDLFVLIFWLVLMWLTGVMAHQRHRSVFLWLLFAFLLTPLLAMLALVVIREHPLWASHHQKITTYDREAMKKEMEKQK